MPRQTPRRVAAAILEDAISVATEGYWAEEIDNDRGLSEEWVGEVNRHLDAIARPMLQRLDKIRKGLTKFEVRGK